MGDTSPRTKLEILKKRPAFLTVAATGKRWVAPSFILQIGDTGEAKPALSCGFTTTIKLGNAVVRNRARRRLRAMARGVMADHAELNRDYVLVGRATTATASFAEMNADLEKGLEADEAMARVIGLILRGLIWVYRYSLSGLIGRQCRFMPSCSAYADEAIRRYGPWIGGWLAIKRLGRCHPWGGSGYDPVP